MSISSAVYSGVCASLGSLFGKLSGLEFAFLGIMLGFATKALLFSMMILSNSLVWTCFVEALHNSDSAVEATAVSSATNYVFSGLFAFIFFNESTGVLWWCGVVLVVLGAIIVNCSSRNKSKNLRPVPKEVNKTSIKGATRELAIKDQ